MTDSPELSRRRWLMVAVFGYGTLAAAIFSFLFYQRQGVVAKVVDLNGFGAIARNIARGDGFSLGYGPTTRRGPLYPFFGAALLKLFGNDAQGLPETVIYRPLLIANCVLFGITCVVVWRLARTLFGAQTALFAAIICPLVPQSLRYVGMTEVETSMGLCTVLLAATSLALLRRPSAGTGALFGAVAGVATLTKPIVLLYPFMLLALALWQWRRARALDRQALLGSVAALACFGALLLPWMLRNMSVTGGQFKGISSNGPGEFLRGYINAQPKYYLLRQDFGGVGDGEKWDPEANLFEQNLLQPHGVTFYRAGRDANGNEILTPEPPKGVTSAMMELEKDRVESAEVRRRVLQEPTGFLRKFAVQFLTFWYIVETRSKSIMVGALAALMLVLAGIGSWRAWRSGVVVWPVLAVLVYFNAIYAAFLGFARYSMPLFPTLTVLAAGGLAALLAPLTRRLQALRVRRGATETTTR